MMDTFDINGFLCVGIVKDTLIQLELYKHRHKLAMSLSGGMKRKLCVAIALIGESRLLDHACSYDSVQNH